MIFWLTVLTLAAVVVVLAWRVWPAPLARLMMALERHRGRLQSCRIEVAERRWHYLEGGHGEPLVLLHGFNGDADHFARCARYLTAHFRILAPDLPGFGETAAAQPGSYRIDHLAEVVLDWLDRVDIRRFYLGGNSMGGYLAVAIARRAPERVRALWLLAPGGLHTAPYSPLYEEIEAGGHNPLVIRNHDDFNRLMDYCFVRPPYIPAPYQRFLAARAARNVENAETIFDAMRNQSIPLEELARDLPTPALIAWGQADQVLHPAGAEVLRNLMPNSHRLVHENTGHLPMLEKPRETAEAWLGFAEMLCRK